MKFVIAILTIVSSCAAFAAGPSDLETCYSSDGSKLEWSQRHGELVITSRTGEVLADVDALQVGETRFFETMPPRNETPIIYGDEPASHPPLGRIVTVRGRTTIIAYGVRYACN